MANQKRGRLSGTALFEHNPAEPPLWPGERTRNMKTKKRGGKKGKGSRNTAAVKQSRPAANKSTRTRNTAKPQTKKKGGYRRNGGGSFSFLRNPLEALKSIDIPTAAGVGLGVVGAKVTEKFVPSNGGYGSPLAKIGVGVAIAWMFGKNKIAQGASLGFVGVGLYEGINVVTGNAVNNFVDGTVARLTPAPAAPAVAADTGMGYVPGPRPVQAIRIA